MSSRKRDIITAIHRSNTYTGPAAGLGCYIQSCEERLMQRECYDSMITHIIEPLLSTDVKTILICIDPLVDDSNAERLSAIAMDIMKKDKRISVIIPNQHVNAAVGRNITFNVIRQINYDKYHTYDNIPKNLLWYGIDDDDHIIADGIRDICEVIHSQCIDVSTIMTVNKELHSRWKEAEGDLSIHHYAQWCYVMSPVYYNGLSYPITPLEKEDLDVFNRLFQYPQFFLTVDEYNDILKHAFTYPYEYQGTNPKRTRGDKLYNTPDVIAYLNAHHSAETKDIPRNVATSCGRKRGYKSYFLNDAERYYLYHPLTESKYSLAYGIALHDDPTEDTHRDTEMDHSKFTLARLLENPKDDKLRALLHRENFNGDLYMVRYTLYTGDRVLFGVSFQNGKDPFDIITDVEKKRMNRRVKRQLLTAKTVGDKLLAVFGNNAVFCITDNMTLNPDHAVKTWNEIILSERKPGRYIPLKTFGGRHKSTLFTDILPWIILIALSLIVLLIFIVIVCVKNTEESIDPYTRFS